MAFDIFASFHPNYHACFQDWQKWRDAYEGGDAFITKYLKKYSKRESDDDFKTRLAISYLPAFAEAAINEIKDSIFQRMNDINRINGPKSFQQAVKGLDGGVDNETTDMNTFIGQQVLKELLVMKEVGIYIDMPETVALTKADETGHPYCYIYKVEDVLNWTEKRIGNSVEFTSVVLRDYENVLDEETKLPTGDIREICRHYWIDPIDGYVRVKIYTKDSEAIPVIKTIQLKKIPFIWGELSSSLMKNVANYQIALLNVASSDLAYTLLSNFPFYVEQDDGNNVPSHLKNSMNEDGKTNAREIEVGHNIGRTYKKDKPDFINPSPEPLQVSMAKQDKMKEEIRQLVQLAVTHLQPKMASAESKSLDSRSLEAGLSCIGLELQRIERKVGEVWAAYESESSPEITYPKNYMLKTDDDRLNEAEKLSKRINDSPSATYKKEVSKKIAKTMLGGSVSTEVMNSIESEIDEAPNVINDATMLDTNMKYGVLDVQTAGMSQGFDKNVAEKAAADHAARIKRIQDAQAPSNGLSNPGARGVNDLATSPGYDAAKEKN